MAQRPYWSGQIRISLVSLPVNVYSAVQRSSQVPLHEYQRSTGERIHHLNVTEDGTPVEDDDIVKGFEGPNGTHVILEQKEIDRVKLPSSKTLELVAFMKREDVPVLRFERPYVVMPDGKDAEEIYAVLHRALADTAKAGIGQIALRGREELCAVIAVEKGLVLETLRYTAELRDMDEFFGELRERKLKAEYLALARQLVEENSRSPDLGRFHDHYHEALMELIKAKQAHRKPKPRKAEGKPAKVLDFMDALRRSLKKSGAATAAPAHRRTARRRSAG